jgi:hypothetical protein
MAPVARFHHHVRRLCASTDVDVDVLRARLAERLHALVSALGPGPFVAEGAGDAVSHDVGGLSLTVPEGPEIGLHVRVEGRVVPLAGPGTLARVLLLDDAELGVPNAAVAQMLSAAALQAAQPRAAVRLSRDGTVALAKQLVETVDDPLVEVPIGAIQPLFADAELGRWIEVPVTPPITSVLIAWVTAAEAPGPLPWTTRPPPLRSALSPKALPSTWTWAPRMALWCVGVTSWSLVAAAVVASATGDPLEGRAFLTVLAGPLVFEALGAAVPPDQAPPWYTTARVTLWLWTGLLWLAAGAGLTLGMTTQDWDPTAVWVLFALGAALPLLQLVSLHEEDTLWLLGDTDDR